MTPKQIGAVMRKARGQRSQREVAGAAGLTPHQVGWIEAGSKQYTVQSLLKLAKALGVRLHFSSDKGSNPIT